MEAAQITVRLTSAQRSALECRPMDEEDTPLLCRTWYGGHLRFRPADADALIREIHEESNAEDGQAEQRGMDRESAKFARAACRALSNLAAKVRRAVTVAP
jgi:hypothetical protein